MNIYHISGSAVKINQGGGAMEENPKPIYQSQKCLGEWLILSIRHLQKLPKPFPYWFMTAFSSGSRQS
jgi:hypothetical protein